MTPDELDAMIAASARALDLAIAPEWIPAVRANLDVTLRLGALVAALPLDDETEPASIYAA